MDAADALDLADCLNQLHAKFPTFGLLVVSPGQLPDDGVWYVDVLIDKVMDDFWFRTVDKTGQTTPTPIPSSKSANGNI